MAGLKNQLRLVGTGQGVRTRRVSNERHEVRFELLEPTSPESPIARFLDQSFQNWTKVDAQIHGAVMLYVDYAAPIDAIRTETKRLCALSDAWDGRTASVQVTYRPHWRFVGK